MSMGVGPPGENAAWPDLDCSLLRTCAEDPVKPFLDFRMCVLLSHLVRANLLYSNKKLYEIHLRGLLQNVIDF